LNERGELVVLTFDRLIEDQISGALVTPDVGPSYLKMDASMAQGVLQKLLQGMQGIEEECPQPVLLVSARIRKAFRTLVAGYISQLVVLSFDEVPPETKIRTYRLIS
jgi:flagellar biosynthesis protein FlhA